MAGVLFQFSIFLSLKKQELSFSPLHFRQQVMDLKDNRIEFIKPKMDENNENIEPVTDLGLALSYSNQCIQSSLNSDSGAGANAGSVLGMTFVATEPLSELVWSTDKGPSNVTLSPQSTTGGRSAAEKPIDEDNFITSDTSFRVKSEAAGKEALTTSPTSDAGIILACGSSHEYETETVANVEEVKTSGEVSILHKQVDTCSPINFEVDEIPEMPETGEILFTTLPGDVDRERDNMMMKSDQLIPFVRQSEPSLGEPVSENMHADDGNLNREMDFILTSKAYLVNESKDSSALVADQSSQGRRPLEKLESTADNDIQKLTNEIAYGAASQKLGSEYLLWDKESFENVEELLPANNSALDKHSPTNSRNHKHRRKGKEKALSDENLSGRMSKKASSDEDLSGRMSKEEDDSHESVESCNSARLVPSGKKRWGFDEQFIVGSKRFRKQIQETPGCTSYVKQDSSFMNWISSMMKGFKKSIQDEALPLSAVHPDHPSESSDKKLITYNKNQDAGIKSIGFQSIFQSLYCPREEDKGTRMSSGNNEKGERYEELEQAIIPKVFHGEKMHLRKGCLLPVGKFSESTSRNEVGSAIQPEILSAKVASSQEKCKNTDSVENKYACNLEYGKTEGGVGSSSSLRKRKKESAEHVESDPQSEGKTTEKFVHGRDLLGSLWVTRFTPKISAPSFMSDRYSVGAVLDCSIDKNNVLVREQSVEDIVVVSANELQDCAADSAGSLAFNRNEGQSNETSASKLNPMVSAPKFGGSEAMASVFARRLDALKHITQSGITGNAADKIITCLFCGIKGHHLRECSKIKDTELQGLPSKFKSYNGAEYLSCFCIRCLECSHWAVACPNVNLGRPQLECNVSNYCSPSQTKLNAEGNMKLIISTVSGFQASVDQDDSRVETDLNWSGKSYVTSKKMRHSSNSVKKYSVSSSGKNKIKEKQFIALSQFVQMPVKDVPKGISDSVKRLRLSRTDVLKWMSSHTSLSNLEGFFLRLRLGKCETGLGGTGYHVSCITGTTGSQSESHPQNARNSISVSVGGIRCVVETQYVSNHDFLEDELRAWWSAMSKNNAKIPSQEDLREKEKMKNLLGL